jgi:integral membrane sensor domain MASE1
MTAAGYIYTTEPFTTSTLWPAIGFATAFYMLYNKESLVPILLAIFLGGLLMRGFFYEESFFLSVFLAFISVISNLIVILIFEKTISLSTTFDEVSVSNIIMWMIASLTAPIFGALLSVSITYIVAPGNSFLQDIFRWSVGNSFGLLIFSSVIFLSYYYDPKKVNFLGFLKSASYIVLASGISYFLFFFGDEVLYYQYAYVYFLIFFTATFFFTFRTFIVLNIMFIASFTIYIIQTDITITYTHILLQFFMFLFSLSAIASVTKIVIHNLRSNNKALAETNIELDKMINSTNSILQMSKVFINDKKEKDEDLLFQMFEIAKNIFHNFDFATCYLKSNDKIYFVDSVGYNTTYLNRLNFDAKTFVFNKDAIEVVNQEVFDEQIKLEIPSSRNQYYEQFPQVKSSVRFGIFLSDSAIGGMSFDQSVHYPNDFSKYDFENFDSFQKLMNGFYEINYLNNKNDKLRNDLVLSLVRTLELYDHYTGGHSEDVAYLSLELAKRMKLSKQDQYDIYWAGIVHDIGKVGVDVNIINKQGKLTAIEFEEVKKHPVHGYNILNRSEDLKRIALWVRSHHEWWNGEGYPDKLVGSEISIGAQVLAVADAVSSMATIRSYSSQKSSQDIKEELILFKGIQFSPVVCEHMIDMIDEGIVKEYFKKE